MNAGAAFVVGHCLVSRLLRGWRCLAIVQRVVKVHGGELHVSNRDGGGLDVHLRLPLATADALV